MVSLPVTVTPSSFPVTGTSSSLRATTTHGLPVTSGKTTGTNIGRPTVTHLPQPISPTTATATTTIQPLVLTPIQASSSPSETDTTIIASTRRMDSTLSEAFPSISASIPQQPIPSAQPPASQTPSSRAVNIGVIVGVVSAVVVIILVVLGLFFMRRRWRTNYKLVALDPFDGSPDSTGASSEHVKGVVTKERINDVATVLESRSKGVIFHTGPSSSGASPSSNTLRPQHKQRRNYPRTEDHLTGDNDSQILYPAPINKPITDVNEVVNPPASSPPQAENNLGIDEGLVQLSELPPRAAGYVSGIQELNRKVAMLQCEIGELRRLGEDVPPAYPGSWYGSQ